MHGPGGNRELIISEAARLFSEQGYEAVGVGTVCDASGITKPTLYHYFGSKRGLLDAIVRERGAPFMEAVREASAYARDVPLGLERIAFAFSRFALRDPVFCRLRLAMSFAPPESEPGEAAAGFNHELFQCVAEFFRRAAGDHGAMRGRHRALAATFIGTVDSYVGFMLARAVTLDDRTVREAVRQFMYGIFS